MIQFMDVTKTFSDTQETALSHVSFHILPGQMAFLLGESGSGKTTLLRLLLRELIADNGTVLVNGQDIGRIKAGSVPAYRRRIGFVFQDFKLMTDRTVYENVAITKRIVGAKERDIRPQVAMALRVVGMEDAFYRPVSELSGGEQQKVCVARAIVGNPYCILADEPTGNLDSRTSQDVMSLLKVTSEKFSQTIVMITHNEEIAQMADRIIRIEDGRIVNRGAGI